MLVPVMLIYFIDEQLSIRGTILSVVTIALNMVFLTAVIVVIIAAANRVAEGLISSPRIHPRGIDAQLIRLVARVLSIFAAVVVLLEGGQRLGIPLTTLIAGAGVGGLAMALAAQDTLKNLFGSVMIILDKPYRVGERIMVKDYDGVVEEIGLRSTKIRLLTGHVATIPNEEMARIDVENVGRRPHIRRTANIAIPYDTPPEKIEEALGIIRRLLENHEGLDPEFPPRVYFNDFNRDSLNLRIIYWYHPAAYWDFLAHSEKLNLDIKREFEAAGIPFALPSTSTYLSAGEEQPVSLKVDLEDGRDAP
jgi:MscS family membrane protein